MFKHFAVNDLYWVEKECERMEFKDPKKPVGSWRVMWHWQIIKVNACQSNEIEFI